MIELRKTKRFADWLDGLRDIHARARVQARINRLAEGNPGDAKSVGEGVSELRIDYGPGYRVFHLSWPRASHFAGGWRQVHAIQRHQGRAETSAGTRGT